jgi:hypothetical protein
MAGEEKKTLSIEECTEVAERLAVGFDKALDDCKPDLDPVLRLAVGIRGALDEVRSDTEAGWIHRTLGRVLAYKGIVEEA